MNNHISRRILNVAALLVLLAGVFSAGVSAAQAGGKQDERPDTPYNLQGNALNVSDGYTLFSTNNSESLAEIGWDFVNTANGQTTVRAAGSDIGFSGIGQVYGVQGSSYDGTGVYGISENWRGVQGHSAANYGVYGTTSSGSGVRGSAISGYAVYGSSGTGTGIYGNSGGNSRAGVHGNNSGMNGSAATGVLGTVDAATGTAFGVRGASSGGATTYGGYFTATQGTALLASSTSGFGIYGYSTNNYGLTGGSVNSFGVRANSTNGIGIYVNSISNYGGLFATSSGSTALRATDNTPDDGSYAIIADGNVLINGTLSCNGACLATSAATDKGDRLLYAETAAAAVASDQGTATLKDGRAVIKIDPLFAQTVNLAGQYQVFVTPGSAETAGLAIVKKTATSFEVAELGKGKGNFAFDWRLTAPREGHEQQRLAPAPVAPAAENLDDAALLRSAQPK